MVASLFLQYSKRKKKLSEQETFPTRQASEGEWPFQTTSAQCPEKLEEFPSYVERDQCLECLRSGHYKRYCPKFLKKLLEEGEDTITFVDESLYLSYDKSPWWIDSGTTVHVTNSLQGASMRRSLPSGRRRIKVANGLEAEVEAIA